MFGIIGGTGLYAFEGFKEMRSENVETPFGPPSAPITIGTIGSNEVAFLPRHGLNHEILPSEINFRANIWALKSLGVTRVIGVSAVGSLAEEIKPGDLALSSQYIDWTRGKRAGTFFGDGLVAHIASAEPTCAVLANRIHTEGARIDIQIHKNKTYICVEGPRLGTRAESLMFRKFGAELVGMTNAPEVFLAREAQMCYCTIAVSTDYDCWQEDPSQHVSVDKVIPLFKSNIGRIQTLLAKVIQSGFDNVEACSCRDSLKYAVLTPENKLSPKNMELLKVLKA